MTQARKNVRKLRDFVSVKDFGAVGDGVTNDTAAIQAAFDAAGAGVAAGIYGLRGETYLVSSTISVPQSARVMMMDSVIKQADGADLTTVILITGGNVPRVDVELSVDGNRDNNSVPVRGVTMENAARIKQKFEFAVVNCDEGVYCAKEVEHADVTVHARTCGVALHVEGGANTPDENRYAVFGYQNDTHFKASGVNKTSGRVSVYAEISYSWAIDIQHGWWVIDGFMRACGQTDGGGVRIGGDTARVMFADLACFAQQSVSGAYWLEIDAPACVVSGSIHGGGSESGAWLKRMANANRLEINLNSPPSDGSGIILGEASATALARGHISMFVQTNTTTGVALDLQNCANMTLDVRDAVASGATYDINIGSASTRNTIALHRIAATSRRLSNSRSQLDNTIECLGDYTTAELGTLLNSSPINGVRVQRWRSAPGVSNRHMGGYYSSTAAAWVPDSEVFAQGQATISSGNSQVTVSHGATVPGGSVYKVMVTPVADPGSRMWVSNKGASDFRINTSSTVGSDLAVDWVMTR